MKSTEHVCKSIDCVHLTSRELETAEDVADGLTNRQIGYKHNLALQTVAHRLSAMFMKCEVQSRAQLVAYLMRKGIIK